MKLLLEIRPKGHTRRRRFCLPNGRTARQNWATFRKAYNRVPRFSVRWNYTWQIARCRQLGPKAWADFAHSRRASTGSAKHNDSDDKKFQRL